MPGSASILLTIQFRQLTNQHLVISIFSNFHTRVFSRNFQEFQGPLCFWIRGPKQNLRGPTKSIHPKECLLSVSCRFDSRHVFFLASIVPLSWLHVPRIVTLKFSSTEMSFYLVFPSFLLKLICIISLYNWVLKVLPES